MMPCGPQWMQACIATLALNSQVPSLSFSLWLQYIGRIFALKMQRFAELMPLLLKRAGLPDGTKLSIYEEIKFDPSVMVDLQNPQHTLANAQLEDGDILCLQEEPSEVCPAYSPPHSSASWVSQLWHLSPFHNCAAKCRCMPYARSRRAGNACHPVVEGGNNWRFV